MSADNTAPGFRAPRVLLPPGTRFALPNGVHCSPDSESGEDLSCPQSRCLPARSLASVLRRLERPVRSPARESFLPCQPPPCSQQGLGLALGFPVLPAHRSSICPSPLCWKCSPSPVKGSRTSPQCYARCPNPRAGREKASKTMQLAKKGKFITDSSQGSCCNQRSNAGPESPEPKLLHKFIG